MRKLAVFLLLIGACAMAHAQQYGLYQTCSLSTATGQAVSGAQVYFLTQPANTSNFTPQAQVYSSSTGGTVTQPLITNGFGECSAYLAPGVYTVCYVSPYTGTLCHADQNIEIGGSGSTPLGTQLQVLGVPANGGTSVPVQSLTLTNQFLPVVGDGLKLPTISGALSNYDLPQDNGGSHEWQDSGTAIVANGLLPSALSAVVNNGYNSNATILTQGSTQPIGYPFSPTNGAGIFPKVLDLRVSIPAHMTGATELGAVCDANPNAKGSTTLGSNQVVFSTLGGSFAHNPLPGESLAIVGTVAGVPTVWEPMVESYNSGTGTATTFDNAPFSVSGADVVIGHDDTAPLSYSAGLYTPISIPANPTYNGGCLTHTLTVGTSYYGMSPNSALVGFPGEDVLDLIDSPTLSNIAIHVNESIDATQSWVQIVTLPSSTCEAGNFTGCAVTTTDEAAADRHVARQSIHSNNPVSPPWCQVTDAAPGTMCELAVAAVTNGSPTITVATGETAPAVGTTVVFQYLTPAFETTVSAVSGQTVTLADDYPGATNSQQEFTAGNTFQTLADAMGTTDTTATFTLPFTVNPYGIDTQMGSDGAYQVDSEIIGYHLINVAGAQVENLTRGEFGTTPATHSSSALVVPLNPFDPTRPYPINPSVNSDATTPLNAEYYPAFDMGNFAVGILGVQDGAGIGAVSFSNLTLGGYNDTLSTDTAGGLLETNVPYNPHFANLSIADVGYGWIQTLPFDNGWIGAIVPDKGGTYDHIHIASSVMSTWLEYASWTEFSNLDVYDDYSDPQIFQTACEQFDWGNYGSSGQPQALCAGGTLNNMYTETTASSQLEPQQLAGSALTFANAGMSGGMSTYLSQYDSDIGVLSFSGVSPTNPLYVFGANITGTIAGRNASNSNNQTPNSSVLAYGSNIALNVSSPFNTQVVAMAATGVPFGQMNQQNGDFLFGGNVTPSTWFGNWNAGVVGPSEFSTAVYEVGAFQSYVIDTTAPLGVYSACAAADGCYSTDFDNEPGGGGFLIQDRGRVSPQTYTVWIPYSITTGSGSLTLRLYAATGNTQQSSTLTTLATQTVSATTTWQDAEFDNVDLSSYAGQYLGIQATGTGGSTYKIGGLLFVPLAQKIATQNLALAGLPSESCLGTDASGNVEAGTCSGSSGTVTSFSAGTLSPLFTTSVATSTTTPALSFSLSNADANTVFGNFTGSSAAPTFSSAPVFSAADLTNFPTLNQNTTGTAANLSGTPALPNGTTATTQTTGDDTTALATDAFVIANAGSGAISGLTSGYIPLAGSATTLTGNSHLDDSVMTPGTITSSEPVAISGSTHGITIPAGTAVSGVAGSVVYSTDSTNGYAEVNENNTGLSRVCTAANGICSGTVSSVFGRTGTVTATTGDYTAAQVTNAAATNAANTFTAGPQIMPSVVISAEYSDGTCTTALDVLATNGNHQAVTLTAGDTCALSFTQPTSGVMTITLKIVQSASGSFNGGISGCKWPGGTVPTITETSGAVDFLTAYLDGTNAYCVASQNFE